MAISHDTRVRVAFHCGRAREFLRKLSILEPAHAELLTNTLVELDRIAELVGGITPAIQRILDAPPLDPVPGLSPPRRPACSRPSTWSETGSGTGRSS